MSLIHTLCVSVMSLSDKASPLCDTTNITMYLRGCAEEFPAFTEGCSTATEYEDVIRWIFQLNGRPTFYVCPFEVISRLRINIQLFNHYTFWQHAVNGACTL